MKKLLLILVLLALLTACSGSPEASSPPPDSARQTPSPSNASASPPPSQTPSPSVSPQPSPTEEPMTEKAYSGIDLKVRQSWQEQTTADGAAVFTVSRDCVIMLRQIPHSGDTDERELLKSVMEALAPGGEYPEFTQDGFYAMSCRYVRESGDSRLQCISYAYAHGKIVTTITVLLDNGSMEAAEAALRPVLDTLKLTAVE